MNATRKKRRRRRALAMSAVAAALAAGAGVWAQTGPEPDAGLGPPPAAATSRPGDPHLPVTFEGIQEYLTRWDVVNLVPHRQTLCVRFQLLVNRRTRLDCLVQIKTKRDGQTFDRLYIGFMDLATVPAGHPRLAEMLRVLAVLNWQNAIGKYSWDEQDGEVRLEYTMLANRGMCYADFADALTRLTLVADSDLPIIQRVVNR